MNWFPVLALLSVAYGVLCLYLVWKKPAKIWQMAKIKAFIKVLGNKGTDIFFIIWGIGFLGLSIWLFTK